MPHKTTIKKLISLIIILILLINISVPVLALNPVSSAQPELTATPATPATTSTPDTDTDSSAEEEAPAPDDTPEIPESSETTEQYATPGTTAIEIQPLALATNKQLSAVAVGDTVKLNVNGTAREFIVVQQGRPSTFYDTSFNNGTWLLMKDLYPSRSWHSSATSAYAAYANSTIHSYLNSTFLNLFDANIRDAVVQVKVPYNQGKTVNSGGNGLATKIFLLSGYEVNWTTSDNSGFPVDGACLSYFSGTAKTDAKRIAYLDGSAYYWWLRSPDTTAYDSAWAVYQDGHNQMAQTNTHSFGVRPALVLPNTLNVDGNGFVAVDVAPTTPPSITVPTSILYNSAFTVSWGTSTSSSNTLGGYILERQINSGTWTQIYKGTATSYSQTLTRNQANTVNYRVKAYSTGGLESGYATGTARTVINNRAPTTPPSFSTQPASSINSWTTSTLTWTCDASTDLDSDGINYIFEISKNGGLFEIVQNSTSRTYTHTVGIPGDNYIQIRVRSYDSALYSDSYLTSSIVTITHDTTKPTIQLTAVPDASNIWVKDTCKIIAIVTNPGASGLKSLTVPSGVTPAGNQTLSGSSATLEFEVAANNTYAFTVENNAGGSSAASITLTKIDGDDPVISYTTTPQVGKYTNQNVEIDFVISDASSGLASFNSLNGSENVSGNSITRKFTASSNGTYPFSASDAVLHNTAINILIDMIDRVKPLTSIVPRVRQWTNAANVVYDITAVDDYSGIGSITRPDGSIFTGGSSTTYEIFNNGTYTASSTDKASNVSDPAIDNYTWFDRTKPTIQFVKFTSTDNPVTSFFANLLGIVSNKHVRIEVTAEDTPEVGEGESGVTHMFYRVFNQAGELVQDWTSSPINKSPVIDYDVNGYVEIFVMDAATNESDPEAYDILIDTKPPEVEVIYSTTEATNDHVDVTLRIISDDGSASKGWILPEGGVLVPQAEITYTFTENAIKTFIAYDTAGNSREVEIRVSNIEALKVPVELWENNRVVMDAIQHATGRRYIEDVSYRDLLKLTFIDLSSNSLTSIPGVFAECANLEHLDLRGNEFEEIPECVYRLAKLRHLDLSNNNLTGIGDGISGLTRLETLDVSLNYLVDYDCPLIVDDYRNVGNFTRSGQADQYYFSVMEPLGADEIIGNTVQLNVSWFYDGQPIGRFEDHRKALFAEMYPQYRTYRPLLFKYEAQNGQIKASTPDYVQVFLNNTGVMAATLRLGA